MKKICAVAAVALVIPAVSLAAPDAQKIFQQRCKACHKINGVGGKVGPDLSKVGGQRDASFLKQKLQDPTKASPDSVMPPYGGSDAETEALVQYLMSLK